VAEEIIHKYLDEMLKQDASDMYLSVGYPPSIRNKEGRVVPMTKVTLRQEDIEKIMDDVLDDDKKDEFESTLELNISIARDSDGSRFRLNFLRQQQKSGIIIRRISTIIPTIEELQLPQIYADIIMKRRGLIILASQGGSGKSTSMAAMLGHRNHHGWGHVLTIEDPIEFVHEQGKCIFTQREVGSDTFSYGMALKNALRQRADVIAIGEIRDRESMDHALRFAETGHLCIATLHSNNASQAVDRIVNFFPDESRQYILSTLSQNLLAIFSQRLLHNVSGGNSLAIEMLLNEGIVKTLIADDKLADIREAIERGRNVGMQTFDQALVDLFSKGEITLDAALSESDNPSALKLKINQGNLGNMELNRASRANKEDF